MFDQAAVVKALLPSQLWPGKATAPAPAMLLLSLTNTKALHVQALEPPQLTRSLSTHGGMIPAGR